MEEAVNSNGKKENWQEIVEGWRASSLSKAEYCKKQKIAVSAFYYWCRKLEAVQRKNPSKAKPRLKSKGKSAVDDKPTFVEIMIPKVEYPSSISGQVFRITTSYGAVMEIPL